MADAVIEKVSDTYPPNVIDSLQPSVLFQWNESMRSKTLCRHHEAMLLHHPLCLEQKHIICRMLSWTCVLVPRKVRLGTLTTPS
jgi:hypothetical protein